MCLKFLLLTFWCIHKIKYHRLIFTFSRDPLFSIKYQMDSYTFCPLCISCSSESVTQSVLLRGSVHCLHESWASSSYTTHSAWQRLLQTSVTRFSPSPNALWAGGQPPPASFLAWSGVCSLVKKSFTKKTRQKKDWRNKNSKWSEKISDRTIKSSLLLA